MLRGYSKVSCNGFFGYVNTDGRELIPIQYDEVSILADMLTAVRQGGAVFC